MARITTSWSSSRRVKAKNLEEGQLQVLYSPLISYYFNAQAGTRQDFSKKSNRTYAVIGLQGLAPGFIETDTDLCISQRGDVSASFTAFYDLLITNRLILQPRVDLKLQAQPVPDLDSGSGFTDCELGRDCAMGLPVICTLCRRQLGPQGRSGSGHSANERRTGIHGVPGRERPPILARFLNRSFVLLSWPWQSSTYLFGDHRCNDMRDNSPPGMPCTFLRGGPSTLDARDEGEP